MHIDGPHICQIYRWNHSFQNIYDEENPFSWLNVQLLHIHTIHILKAVVPAVNLAYLGTVYMHPVTRLIFRKIVGINWQY